MSNLFIQFISIDPPCLLVTTERDLFLFNVPSNTVRTMNANRFLPSLKDLKHIYFDSLYSERQNGISGVIFSAYNSGVRDLKITAPLNIYHYMQYFRFFIRRSDLNIEANAISNPIIHNYKNLQVEVIPFFEDVEEVLSERIYEKKQKPSYQLTGDTNRVYVGGFEESTTKQDLQDWFGMYGEIEEIDLPYRPSDPSKCRQFGYIQYNSKDAVKALFKDWFKWKKEKGIHIEEDTSLELHNYFGETWRVHPLENDKPLKESPPLTNRKSIHCYILKANDKRGKFNVVKALQLGVPKGKDFARLTNGETIVTPDGKTVKPQDVMGESLKGSSVLIISVPNSTFLKQVIESSHWHPYFVEEREFVVYHLVPPEILKSQEYYNFISKFSQSSQHIIVNEHCERLSTNQDSLKLQVKLHAFNQKIYPIPTDEMNIQRNNAQCLSLPNIREVNLFEKYSLDPGRVGFYDKIDKINIDELFNNTKEEVKKFWETNKQSDKNSFENDSRTDLISKIGENEGEFCILGTASANPSKYRAVTSIFLNFFHDGCAFLDCGEGSLAQLYRIYGQKTEQLLLNLKLIFISHLHADHHCDLVNILTERTKIVRKFGIKVPPVILIANDFINNYLIDAEISSFDDEYNFLFINGTFFDSLEYKEKVDLLKKSLKLSNIHIPLVTHGKVAYAIILERESKCEREPYKIVFSGDCRPSDDLIEKGKDALILIHEATFEEELKEEAIKRKHTTVDEATTLSEKMNAYITVLMHFSQRYPCAPPIIPDHAKRVYTSFDLMKVNFQDLQNLENLESLYERFFKEEIEESEIRNQEFVENHMDCILDEEEFVTCRFYSIGRCFSPECSYKHDPEAPFTICRFGSSCMFKEGCWLKHINEAD